jgi:lipoic acid synthetase
VTTGVPDSVNKEEIDQVTDAVKQLGLKFVVITSPARDDLKDGGAEQFYEVTQNLIAEVPGTQVELLVPDFLGNLDSIKTVANSGGVIVGHNIETVPRLYSIRKASVYQRSLDVLQEIKKQAPDGVKTKSAIMVGLGESEDEVVQVMKDLLAVDCKLLSIGQYLAPSHEYEKVLEYVTPEQFDRYKKIALDMGFEYVHSSPYARSSYMAHEYVGEKHV